MAYQMVTARTGGATSLGQPGYDDYTVLSRYNPVRFAPCLFLGMMASVHSAGERHRKFWSLPLCIPLCAVAQLEFALLSSNSLERGHFQVVSFIS